MIGHWLRRCWVKLRNIRPLRCRIESVQRAALAWNPAHSIFVREYYLYCISLFRDALARMDVPVNLVFGDYPIKFPLVRPTLRIDLQIEHTLVKPGGRDSAAAPMGRTPLPDGNGFYLVRLEQLEKLRQLDLIIEYSLPNVVHVRDSGLFPAIAAKTLHIAPLLYSVDFGRDGRDLEIISLIADTSQERRARFLQQWRDSGLPARNFKGIYGSAELRQLYRRTRILVNLHQTDHHDTLEELRILPALLNGVLVISEDVPLRRVVPYHEFIIWCGYGQLLDTVRAVHADYAGYFERIFGDPRLREILTRMQVNNRAAVERQVETWRERFQ